MREELRLTWKEIARVVGAPISMVLEWNKKFGRDGEAGLRSWRRGRRYLTDRTLTLAQEGQVRSILVARRRGNEVLGLRCGTGER